ncbi:MAG TPA: EthD domain-containing protein [Solirubrobacteraceae bacterium]|jgi:hypothetical protein
MKLFAFSRRPGLDLADLLAADLGRLVERAVENRMIPGAAVPHMALADIDIVWELWLGGREAVEAVLPDARWRERLEDCVVVAAEESVQFDHGGGAVKFMALSRRSQRFATRAEWIRYWIEVHGPLAYGIPEFARYYGRYVHNYVVPVAGLDSPFDGIVEEWVESVEAFGRCLAEPKYLELVAPDEQHFVDFSRSLVFLVEERTLDNA